MHQSFDRLRKTRPRPAGRTLRSLDQLDKDTAVTYDASGNQLTVRDPNNVGADMVYDALGRNTQRTDTFGDITKTDYDRSGRMTSRNYRTAANSPSGTIADTDTFTFDRAGRMLTAVNGRYTNTVTYAFDPAGRKASEGLTISGQTYTIGSSYNARNELVKYTYPDGSVADRAYTARGALSQLKLDTATVGTRTYDDGGRMLTSVLGNGITETRAYRTDNLLTSINSSNTNLGNLAYTWDANKNKTAETITGVMSNYGFTAAGTTYDFEDRLTGFQRAATSGPALLSQSWSLSTVGDWNSVTTNGTAQTRTHGPTHELLTAGGQAVNTDVKGNTTLLPSTLSSQPLNLQYDFDNKLRTVDVGNDSSVDVNYQYDALGRRVARTGTGGSVVYIQADQQTIADYPLGGAPATPTYRYVYASYIDEPVVRKSAGTSGTVHYYHRNQQYSIYAITDAAANIAERYAYTAYGQPTILNAAATVIAASAVSNRYTYTAREWDATVGLYHFRARWMSGLTGRFLTRDPIGYAGSKWDLYEYVGSNPPKSIDPMGLETTMTWQGTTCKTILLPGTLDCTCGSRAAMKWGVVATVTAAIQAEFPGVRVSIGGNLAASHDLSITCNLPSCPSSCGCDEEKKCDRKQELRGHLKVCVDKFRVQTDPYVICIPFSQYEETCFTIWPGSDTTIYAYSSHSFGEKVISDIGDCACVATK